MISIHAPLAGRDFRVREHPLSTTDFNPRAPCGARLEFSSLLPLYLLFQSTRPLRGATMQGRSDPCSRADFNPRAPCGARPEALRPLPHPAHFNPRAPCGARPSGDYTSAARYEFQSTRPLRGATTTLRRAPMTGRISIHAPLAGRDRRHVSSPAYSRIFQSTRPLRGATISGRIISTSGLFQSTRPLRGATVNFGFVYGMG